jgi:MFS family permease
MNGGPVPVRPGPADGPVHLDHNTTTPVDPRAAEAILPHLTDFFGNPSGSHPFSAEPRQAPAEARAQVAALIGARADEVVLTASGSGLTLLAAGILAATAPGDSVALLALALALLGLGWNFGLVSGTAIITDAVPLATRARTQGTVDVFIAIAGATGGLTSGIVVAAAGYPVLALTGGALALAILPAIAATAGSR